jgi:hypothetical protein
MVSEQIRIAVLLVILVGGTVLAHHLGVLRSGSRVWRTCLFWAGIAAILGMSVDVMEFGFADALSGVTLIVVAVCALGGALGGLFMSFMERRWPS